MSGSELTLVQFGRLIYGPDVDCKTAREFFEPSSPTTQCNNTIGSFINGTVCYICGMFINSTDIPNDGQNPECEHILPILQAMLYLGLYRDKNTNTYPYLDYEYAWAHRTCNQIKSDKLFINLNNEGKFIVNSNQIKQFLTSIWNTSREDSVAFKHSLHERYRGVDEFRSVRSSYLEKHVFQKIADYLNSFNAPTLLMFAGICQSATAPTGAAGKRARETRNPINLLRYQEEEYNKSIELVIPHFSDLTTIVKSYYNRFIPVRENNELYENFNTKSSYFRESFIRLLLKLQENYGTIYNKDWDEFVLKYLHNLFIFLIPSPYKEKRQVIAKQEELTKNTINPIIIQTWTEMYPVVSGGAVAKKKNRLRKRTTRGLSRKGGYTKKYNSKTRKRT
jgi:hypothetical protein